MLIIYKSYCLKSHILKDMEMFSGLQDKVSVTLNASEDFSIFYFNGARWSVQLTFRAMVVLFYGHAFCESYPTHRNWWELNTPGRLCVQYCIPEHRQTISHTVCELRNLETSILSNSSPVSCLLAPLLLLCRVNSFNVLYGDPHSKLCSPNDKTVDSTLGEREPGYMSWMATLSRARSIQNFEGFTGAIMKITAVFWYVATCDVITFRIWHHIG